MRLPVALVLAGAIDDVLLPDPIVEEERRRREHQRSRARHCTDPPRVEAPRHVQLDQQAHRTANRGSTNSPQPAGRESPPPRGHYG